MGFLDVAEDINEPAPIVGYTAGKFEVADGDAGDKQTVKITHIAGDDVPVKELEIVVRASGPSLDTTARLFNLPAEGQYMTDNVDGNKELIDSRTSRAKIIEEGDSNTWETGDTMALLKSSAVDSLPPNRSVQLKYGSLNTVKQMNHRKVMTFESWLNIWV